jgi:hypothetical protein
LPLYAIILFRIFEEKKVGVISGFRRDVDDICALLGYYAV